MINENLYYEIRKYGGWLNILADLGMTEKRIAEYEMFDEETRVIEKALELRYKINFSWKDKQNEFEFIREIEKEFQQEVTDIKKEIVKAMMIRLQEITNNYAESRNKGLAPFWLYQAVKEINKPELLIKQIKKLQNEILFLEDKIEFQRGMITEIDIQKAKAYPFEALVQKNEKQDFIICPFHKEKTGSFYVKNNFGYCFSCQKGYDTIEFIMQTKEINFIEAVKFLAK